MVTEMAKAKAPAVYQAMAQKWVKPAVEPKPEPITEPVVTTETAADRRNWLRKQAGWPLLRDGLRKGKST